MDLLLIMWIVLTVVFVVIEALTVQIVTIWFAAGSVGAIIANILDASGTVQLLVFVAVSAITLAVARPLLKKYTKTEPVATNADMLIGKKAVVTERIENENSKGRVCIGGADWAARSLENQSIEKGQNVLIKSIEGVKLIVTKEE